MPVGLAGPLDGVGAGAAVVNGKFPLAVAAIGDRPPDGAAVVVTHRDGRVHGAPRLIEIVRISRMRGLILGVQGRGLVPVFAHLLDGDGLAVDHCAGAADELGLALADHPQHVLLGPFGHQDVAVLPAGHPDVVDHVVAVAGLRGAVREVVVGVKIIGFVPGRGPRRSGGNAI